MNELTYKISKLLSEDIHDKEIFQADILALQEMGYTKELIVALGAIAYASNRESEFLGRTLDRLIGAQALFILRAAEGPICAFLQYHNFTEKSREIEHFFNFFDLS